MWLVHDNTIVFSNIRSLMLWKNILFNPPKQDGLNQISCEPIHQIFKRSLWKLVIAMSLLLFTFMVKSWRPVNVLNYLAFSLTINWSFINISARYAHECLVKSMSWAEYLSSCPQIASPSCSTHSYCQTFCIVPFCGFLFKSWYVQNEKGSEKGIETITEWLYIIVLRTTRKCQPPPLCVPYRD